MSSQKINIISKTQVSSGWVVTEKVTAQARAKDEKIKTKTITSGPTTGASNLKVNYAIPSGSKVKKAQIWAKISVGTSGASRLTANGNPFNLSNGGERGANVTLSANAGTLDVKLEFRANGNTISAGKKSSYTVFENVYLLVEYEAGSGGGSGGSSSPYERKDMFTIPPQSVCVYDPGTGRVFMFDGVTKIQHTATLKVEEEPDAKKKSEYINNARNEPDKIALDVIMSDVYDDPDTSPGWNSTPVLMSDLAKLSDTQNKAYTATYNNMKAADGAWTRSDNAYRNLHYLKTARKKLCLITPQFVYTNMLLTGLTISQDENYQFGWEGQLTFEELTYETKKKNGNSAPTKNTSETPPSPSWFAQHGVSL